MNAKELLATVTESGLEVFLDNEELVVRPKSGIPEHLVPELYARAGELRELLKRREGTGLASTLAGVATESPSVSESEILAMSLDDFAEAGLVVPVRSRALGEIVVFASDNALVDPGEGRTVYRAEELRELLGLSTDDLRALHRVKKTFRGKLLPS